CAVCVASTRFYKDRDGLNGLLTKGAQPYGEIIGTNI
ncbi:MAG: hypothetical protein ACJA0G_001422, partial [Kangiellaceae bacterium]